MTAAYRHLRDRRITRRELLGQVGAFGAGLGLIANRPAVASSPNEKLHVAVVGVGGRGRGNLNGVQHENIVALCDVDQGNLAAAAERFPKAKTYADYRQMLDRSGDDIDAVLVSTPDHTHAVIGAAALELGKHLYCEKPLTRSVHETRVLTELARKRGAVTQMGTQIHAGDNYRRVVELIRSAAIGPVEQVYVWHGGNLGGMDRPQETPPVPESLDWDLWLGPALYRPYHSAYAPTWWRAWWAFGNGTLGDFGCHYMDLPFWALDLKYPTTIESEGPPIHAETTPPALTVNYEFPARESLPPVRLVWQHGGRRPRLVAEAGLPDWAAGVLFVGRDGMLQADYTRHLLAPEEKFADFAPPQPSLANSIGHHREWTEACKTGGPTTCSFDYSGPLTEAVLLGNVAYRAGAKLRWDGTAAAAIDCPDAHEFLHPPYRDGWTLGAPAS